VVYDVHMLRSVAIFVVASAAASLHAEQFGAFDVRYDSGQIQIAEAGSAETWTVEAADLPIKLIDCENRMPCPPGYCVGVCVSNVQPFAMDSQRRALYFSASMGIAQNTPHIIFRYSLRTRRVTRLTNEWGGGFGVGAVSPSGRYLAYVMYPHNGVVCPARSWLGVVDMQTYRSASVHPWGFEDSPDPRHGDIRALHWSAGEVTAEVGLMPKICGGDLPPPAQEQYRVNVRDLKFK
jgi:hypothetical protein